MEREIKIALKKLDLALSALQEIVKTQGKVCDEFEVCEHISCLSSYSSWVIASNILVQIQLVGD